MYNDDAFATMLLTIPLSADRAEYARPLNTAEYARLLARVKSSAAARLGALLHVDISGLMMLLGVSEEEGERWFHEEIVPYFQARPEVNRFLSSRIYHDVVGCTFHRLVELWFDGPEEWYQAAVEGAKALPKPVWAQQERFPFLKSNFNIVGMFLTDIPTSDNLTQFRGYITMR